MGLDAIHLFDQLLAGERPAMDQDLARELLGAGARALKPCQKSHLELGLDPGDLFRAEALLGGLDQLVADHGEQIVGPVGGARRMDGHHAAVG